MELSVWAAMAWVGQTKGPMLVACYFLQLHCSSKTILEVFLVMACFSDGGYRLSYVARCEEDPMRVMALHNFSQQLLEAFLVTTGSSGNDSRLGFVVGNNGSLLKAVVWSGTTWAGRTVTIKSLA